MSQSRAAAPRLFRTLLQLTKDLERVTAEKSSFDLKKALNRRGHRREILNAVSSVEDLRTYLKETFRRSINDDDEDPSKQEWKDRVALAIKGVQHMEHLIQDAHNYVDKEKIIGQNEGNNTSQSDDDGIQVHDGWIVSYINQVEWLPCLLEESSASAYQEIPPSTSSDDESSSSTKQELPMFPLTGPFMVPNQQPLELFTPYSYWNFPTPGAEIPLRIFEPRYRELYTDLLVKGHYHDNKQWFVVPFSHPTQTATYAQMGLLYEVTKWQEVADETNGVFQYLCQHTVRHPVRIHKVLNPDAWSTQETYLRVEATIIKDDDNDGRGHSNSMELSDEDMVLLELALQKKLSPEEHIAVCGALRSGGLWSFVRIWNKGLQQRISQIELYWAGQIKLAMNQQQGEEDNNSTRNVGGGDGGDGDWTTIASKVQWHRREEFLQLKIDLALNIPRLLQTQSSSERLELLLEWVQRQS